MTLTQVMLETVLIVRSSELFKVEKLVAEQEEPTQTVTDSIPITTVKGLMICL